MRTGIQRALVLSLLSSGVGLALLLWLGPPLDPALLWRADLRWLAAALLGANGLWFAASALRVQAFCREQGVAIDFVRGMRVHALGVFGAILTPGGSGGAPAVALALTRQGMSAATGWAVAIGMLAIDTLFFSWSLPVALLVLIGMQILPRSSVWLPLGAVGVLLSSVLAYLLLVRLPWLRILVGWLFRGPLLRARRAALRTVDRFVAASSTFPYHRIGWQLRMQGLTLMAWLSVIVSLQLTAAAYGSSPNPVALVAFELVVIAISSVVPTPGASGFIEASTGAVLLQLDPAAPAPAITLAWRVVTYYIFFLIGPPLGGYLVARMLERDP